MTRENLLRFIVQMPRDIESFGAHAVATRAQEMRRVICQPRHSFFACALLVAAAVQHSFPSLWQLFASRCGVTNHVSLFLIARHVRLAVQGCRYLPLGKLRYRLHLAFEPNSGVGVILLRNYGSGRTNLGGVANETLLALLGK